MNLRTAPANAMSVDELVIAKAFLTILSNQIVEDGNKVPQSVSEDLQSCTRELSDRLRAEKKRELANLRLRREGLLSQNERRKIVDDQIAALENELGETSKTKRAARGR